MPFILTIDLGTSGPKVALFTAQGELVAHTARPTSLIRLPRGGVEQQPDEWWRAVTAGVRDLLARDLAPAADIVAVCCTGQWSGTVALDEHGRALRNAIIWMDSRGAPQAQAITAGFPGISGYGLGKLLTWLRLTGGIPTPSGKDSIAHILWLKEHEPETYRRAYKFLEPKDYLNMRLTGRFRATFDSITLHWVTDNRDLERIDYSPRLLAMAGIAREKLPDLIRAVDVVGPLSPQAAQELGLGEHVQVLGGTPDIHSAAVGSGATADFEPHLYLGTSSWLICHVPFKKTDLFHNMASLPSALPGRYLLINEQESAGACVEYLLDEILFPGERGGPNGRAADVYDRFNELAASAPPGSNRLIFLPWLNGERTPVEQHAVRGGFFNQSLRTGRPEMARAVLEGVAYNTRWLLHYVERFAGRRLDGIRVIGGGAQSPLWCRIIADVLDRELLLVEEPLHVNTRGAALLAALGLGCLDAGALGAQVRVTERFRPNPRHRQLYDELYDAFLQYYRQTHRLQARLNQRPAPSTDLE